LKARRASSPANPSAYGASGPSRGPMHDNHDRVLSTRRREQPHATHRIMPIPPARAPPPASPSIPASA
jgi:hypothetical protein